MKRVFTIPGNTHGPGPVFFSWQTGSGNFLVTTGYDHMVNVYDRHGERLDQLRLPGMCSGLSWDKEGDVLSVISDISPIIFLYDSNSKRVSHVDTGLKDTLTFILWSKSSPILAVGTSKGNLLIYNHRTSRKVPVLGKHSKQITCGAWSEQNYIALVGMDKVLTVSNTDGDTLCQNSLKQDPSLVQFSMMKQDDRSSGENTVSLILNKKSLYLINIYNPENPIVLAFQAKYGDVVEYKWYGDGYILLAFSNGFFIVISTVLKEIGQELIQINCHKGNLIHMAACLSQNKVASCGENIIKIYDLLDMKEVLSVITVDVEKSLDWMEWTDDGSLLAASGTNGTIYVFLTSLPILGDTCNSRIALLTSLREVTVFDAMKQESSPNILKIDVEPSFLALGPYHIAVGMNNRAWFYGLGNKDPMPVQDREYLGTVSSLKLNSDYVSALSEGKIQLHIIDNEECESEEREAKLFPDGDYSNIRITCHALTDNFLIYATDTGVIQFFSIADWSIVNDYKHSAGIRNVYPDPSSTRLIVVDDKMEGFLYNPVVDEIINIEEFPTFCPSKILWDSYFMSKGIFLAYDDQSIHVHVHSRTIKGSKVLSAVKMKLPAGQFPLLLYDCIITCQTQSGKTSTHPIHAHQLDKSVELSKNDLKEMFQMALQLKRFHEAWDICYALDEKSFWHDLGKAAMYDLDIDFAIKVYQNIPNIGMVWFLRDIEAMEDKSLMAGHIAVLCEDYNLAQDLFLASETPYAALEMRRHLLDWDTALQLAEKLAPVEIPFISKEYAQQLEFMGDYANAKIHYEKGILGLENSTDHDEICSAGIARTSLRCSDLRRGIAIAKKLQSSSVKKECAEILESIKQYADAADLYESGDFYDKAAWLYLKLKNWDKLNAVLPYVTSPKLLSQYAKAKETDGQYEEALKAYNAAQDFDNAVRILLNHMNNLEEAVKIVKEVKSLEGAKMVARFFQKIKDIPSAITFLVMSKCKDEAFQLAQSTSKMELYAEAIGDDATEAEYSSIAAYFEKNKNFLEAGKFYVHAGQEKKAVKLLLQAGTESNEAIQFAIQAVGEAEDEELTRQVIKFLMGETDGIPKDFKYLFQLYMALKQYPEAGKTAVIIAREEQNAGNYRNAHSVLFSMYHELKKHKIKIPSEMVNNLMVLHSYILIKIQARIGNHLNSAHLLIRVTNHLSKFPSHVVQILTSAVIECQRAGLKKSAFNFAAMLMRPEYRSKIDAKYKKKLETIVRKPDKTELEPPSSPCPHCNTMLHSLELTCTECRNSLPFCIVSGYHIVKEDLTVCSKCQFPASYSAFLKLLGTEKSCPMCNEDLNDSDIKPITDVSLVLDSENT